MASLDLSQLQNIINNATKNETLVSEIRKAAARATKALGELNALLAEDYQPEVKERKPRAPKAPKELGEVDPNFPYGKKKDGTPKAKSGRSKEAAE
ncbi:hypothetical protein Q5H92_24675 [Hymenobacter sp. M29]|uniref:Histone n=1 Tax=Hymenobacter mellowenesis TaxID=3063995 RepID=A0ABT9AI83_9BACT|nr:hypothetical protein [Hymenobacter sp. M29]MDO7849580.1 hypothetical protein [Hymenobacter sp. M29]